MALTPVLAVTLLYTMKMASLAPLSPTSGLWFMRTDALRYITWWNANSLLPVYTQHSFLVPQQLASILLSEEKGN